MGKVITNIESTQNNRNMARTANTSAPRPAFSRPYGGRPYPYRHRRYFGGRGWGWGAPIILATQPVIEAYMVGDPCSASFTDSQGRTWIYRGTIDRNGQCHYYSRTMDSSAFNGEQAVWADCQGERSSNLDGDPCAFKNPDGSISSGVMSGGVCLMPAKGKGWDFANKLLDTARDIVNLRGGSTNITVPAPPEERKGISALGVVGIVAGVGLLGFLAYKMAK